MAQYDEDRMNGYPHAAGIQQNTTSQTPSPTHQITGLAQAAAQPIKIGVRPLDLNNKNDRKAMNYAIQSNGGNTRNGNSVAGMQYGQNKYGIQWGSDGRVMSQTLPQGQTQTQTKPITYQNKTTNNMGLLGRYRNKVGNGQTYSWDSNNNAFYTEGNNVGVGTTGLAHSGANVQLDPNTRYNFGNNRIGRKLGAAYDAATGTINTANLGRRSMRRLRKVLNRQGMQQAPIVAAQDQQVPAPATTPAAPAAPAVQTPEVSQQSIIPPIQWNIPGVSLNSQNEPQWSVPSISTNWWNTWSHMKDPYISPSVNLDWANGIASFNIDPSWKNWQAYSRQARLNTSVPSETSSMTVPTVVTVPPTPKIDLGEVNVANEAKKRRAAAGLKQGGALKAQYGASLQQNPNSTLAKIMSNEELAAQFAQALGMSIDDLVTAAADPEMSVKLEQLAQKMMKQSAKQGAKLEYISLLRGKCPEGQELVYFAKGGKICSACMGKKMEDGGEAGYMKSFRDRQKKKQMEKCGGKMKKGK